MMRRGDSANFWILQEMTKRLKGFVSDTGIKPFLWFDEKTAQLPSMLGDCYAIHHQIYLLARRLSFNPGTGAVVENIKWSTRAPPIKIGEIYWSARRSRRSHMVRFPNSLKLQDKFMHASVWSDIDDWWWQKRYQSIQNASKDSLI